MLKTIEVSEKLRLLKVFYKSIVFICAYIMIECSVT